MKRGDISEDFLCWAVIKRDALALAAITIAIFWPVEVFAITLGDIVCNIRTNIIPFLPLFNAMAYIAGAILVFNGALLMKKHADNPNDSQIVKAIAHFLGGGALAAFPYAIGTLQKTLHVSTSANGVRGCTPGEVTSAAAGLDVIMQNLVKNIQQPMLSALSVLCLIIGCFLIYRGLIKGSKIGTDPRAAATHSILVNLIMGAVLVSIGGVLPAMLTTLFGSESIRNFSSIINWSKITGGGVDTTKADLTIKSILMFVQIIGVIAFIRGWLIVKNAIEGTGQVTVPQGITHIIGGTMAINIGLMLEIFDRTFGTGLVK